MKILKFGGTSVGSAQRMKNMAELIRKQSQGGRVIVVLSAMAGTTNTLLQIADYLKVGNKSAATELVNS